MRRLERKIPVHGNKALMFTVSKPGKTVVVMATEVEYDPRDPSSFTWLPFSAFTVVFHRGPGRFTEKLAKTLFDLHLPEAEAIAAKRRAGFEELEAKPALHSREDDWNDRPDELEAARTMREEG